MTYSLENQVLSESLSFPPLVFVDGRKYQCSLDIDVILYYIYHKLTPADRMVLRAFVYLGDKYDGDIRVSREVLASIARVAPISVTRAIPKLQSLNLIRRFNLGGSRYYILADEVQSVNFNNIDCTRNFDSDNDKGINKKIYIYTQAKEKEMDTGLPVQRSKTSIADAQDVSMERIESQKTETLIKHYVAAIDILELNFGERYRLSNYPESVINKALYILRNNPNSPRTFPYFDGICKRVSSNNTNKGKFKQKYRIESRDGINHAIDLKEEERDNVMLQFGASRAFLQTNTTGSAFVDHYFQYMLGIHGLKQAAQEQFLALNREGKDAQEFIDEIIAINQWDARNDVAEIDEMVALYEFEQSLNHDADSASSPSQAPKENEFLDWLAEHEKVPYVSIMKHAKPLPPWLQD